MRIHRSSFPAHLVLIAWALFFVCIIWPGHVQGESLQVERLKTIDEEQKIKTQQIAEDLLAAWEEGRFEKLSDDFTSRMQTVMSPAFQKQSSGVVKNLFGNFESLRFVEAVKVAAIPGVIIYRFRGTFDKPSQRPEVRVVIDKSGKVAGFWVKYWHDDLR